MQNAHEHFDATGRAKDGGDRARFDSPGDEFPADYFEDRSITRRAFLAGLSAAIALTASGCKRKSNEAIVPYVRQPVGITPGRPVHFATTMTLSGYAQGVIATSREGRPIKLEGNPDHPASLGGTDVFMQAAIYDLYDPDRCQAILHAGVPSDWDQFAGALASLLQTPRDRPASVAILTETVSSPTMLYQLAELRKKLPGARWYVHEPLSRENIREGLRSATGRAVLPRYDFAKTKAVVSLDCDFLREEPGHLRYARDFIDGRRIRAASREMNRLYVLESTSTITGSQADHRWAPRPSRIAAAAAELLGALRGQNTAAPWAGKVAADLLNNRGSSIVLAGAHQPPAVHAAVHAINDLLGNIGKTVFYDAFSPASGDGDLAELTNRLNAGNVDALLILGGNPVYTALADVGFADALKQFSLRSGGVTARLGLYDDETAELCQWVLPQTHFLEEWTDARAFDGTVSLCQPLIDPLYNGRSAIEVLELLRTQQLHSGYEIVREYWAHQQADDFDNVWRTSLRKGVWTGAQPTATVEPTPQAVRPINATQPTAPSESGLEISFRPDPCLWDGCYANNAFLQELPKPMTKLTWDNAAMLSPASAANLGVETEDVVELSQGGRTLRCAVCVLPGQPDGAITLHLGGGRWRSGRAASGAGFNANVLRTANEPWLLSGVAVRPTGEKYQLAATRTHQTLASRHLDGVDPQDTEVIEHPGEDSLDERKLVRVATLEQFIKDPGVIRKMGESESLALTLYPGYESTYDRNFKWGMSIDMQSCIGCSACVAACQTENNISVVGKDQVLRGREMHWLRIDTYYAGPEESPTAAFHQPVPCMQCENAPCELVCPVGATVHDNEGLNDMVYNRCVGTRYCSNNCPYKVRRFNFLQYADDETESLKLMRNPEVTVRTRGVMEKCTYCIQRITATRIDMELAQAKAEESPGNPADPEAIHRRQDLLDQLQTACQQACPTKAIVFGNINPAMEPIRAIDASHLSEVSELKQQPHNYTLLEDLTTRPRTSYLARIVNPNPALAGVEGPA